jgi:carboxyl-terminal processing protease
VISLYNFSGNSQNLFSKALREFTTTGGDKLIIDLRNNPGGYLEASVEMLSYFLPQGKVVVRENFGEKATERTYRSKGYNIFANKNIETVVLVNGGSASASEIFAGALSDHNVATIIGSTTFGKGSVQELIPITDNTYLKVTVSQWLTPNGTSFDEGFTPDHPVEMTKEDYEEGRDPQMDKAVSLLLSR